MFGPAGVRVYLVAVQSVHRIMALRVINQHQEWLAEIGP